MMFVTKFNHQIQKSGRAYKQNSHVIRRKGKHEEIGFIQKELRINVSILLSFSKHMELTLIKCLTKVECLGFFSKCIS